MTEPASAFGVGLGTLPLLAVGETRSVSPENPTGAPGGGGAATPAPNGPASRLGKGWKARPCIDLPPGETAVLADLSGPGVIQHIWVAADPKAFRGSVLRVHWDGEPTPSVEVPLGDFFACGHGLPVRINSLPIAVNPTGGLNCYWPMPFRKSARLTLENQHGQPLQGLSYQITYALQPLPDHAACFHAQWRRSVTGGERPEHTLLDDVCGQGHYVGTYLAWTPLSNGWWGEGEVKFYIDDDDEAPSICGTGTEDYFGGAWGFYGPDNREEPYSTPFLGLPLVRHVAHEVPRHGLYRWHVLDPIRFRRRCRVTVQTLGWWPDGKYRPRADDIASTAFWYQVEPHAHFPVLPGVEDRWPR